MEPIKIGLLGLGTVGGGTAKVLLQNAEIIERRLGRKVSLFMAADKRTDVAKSLCPEETIITDDAFKVIENPEVDIVVELIGGSTIAKELVLAAIKAGKHVVTANKKLLAEYGNEIFKLAEEKNVMVMFEAAVAGSVPIIKILRESFAANTIQSIAGIINGTSNYILTQMLEASQSFEDALKDAQKLGYAEADPTFDIEGQDAAHKLTIMASLAFGIPLAFDKCYIEGISKLESQDISYANELGYKVKLLGITRKVDGGVELRVHPTLIPKKRLISNVNGVMNAVWVHGDLVGQSLHYGAGAGSLPTASAVVADILDISRLLATDSMHRVPHLAFQPSRMKNIPILPIDDVVSGYYLRIIANDESGVLAKVSEILARENISIEALLQKSVFDSNKAEIVILTHTIQEKRVTAAIKSIEALECTHDKVRMIRMESFHVEN